VTRAASPPVADVPADGEPADGPRPAAARTRPVWVNQGLALLRRAGNRFSIWTGSLGALDTAVCMVYLACAFWLTQGLWPHPGSRALANNVNDQALIEWFLAHGVLFWKGDFSFVTTRLNSPQGVNLMSNASHILHGILMAPVTVLFGVAVSFAVLVGLNLAATAAGWYLVFARTLGLHRLAAFIGALLAGFGPGMISQSNSHLHITAQWLIPPIVATVIGITRARSRASLIRRSVLLAVLLSAQLLLGEEVLFLSALALAIFAVVYAIRRLRWTRTVLLRTIGGLAITGALTAIAIAYPVWVQFKGPQHTPNAPFSPDYYYADLKAFGMFSPLSIAGTADAARLSSGPTEFNTYLGLPLLLIVAVLVLWRWRSATVLAATVSGLVMFWLSLGPTVKYDTHETSFPSLYKPLANIPAVNSALPTRYALTLLPLIAVILAYALDKAFARGGIMRYAVPIAVIGALVPLAPKQMETTARLPVPLFISSGDWRQCVPEGGVLVPVPLPTPDNPDSMRWAAAADDAFGLPEGFFIGPYGAYGSTSVGVYPQPTSTMLAEVARTGVVPNIDNKTRDQAHADIRYWKASCVALAAQTCNLEPLRETLELLFGPGTVIQDTWTWKFT
jgi:hypothetical protein